MTVVLTPCRVPWAVSPSMSGLTLLHSESDVEPECSITFGGGRLGDDGLTDIRSIELQFKLASYTRTAPKGDDEDIEASGFSVSGGFEGPVEDYLNWLRRTWRSTGFCPNSGFYIVANSEWLRSVRKMYGYAPRHYLLAGRDGFIEVIADSYCWREWLWNDGERHASIDPKRIVATGSGVD